MAAQPNIEQLHQTVSTLNGKDIQQLQAIGLQQAGRYGLRQDSRIFFIFGVVGLFLALVNPIFWVLRVLSVVLNIVLIGWSIKAYKQTTIQDMALMVYVLSVVVLGNVLGGIGSLLMLMPINIGFGIFWIGLAVVEARWARNLWQSHRIAADAHAQVEIIDKRLYDFYFGLSHALATVPPHINNAIMHFGQGRHGLRLLLSQPYGLIFHQNGLLRVMPPQAIAMRPAEGESQHHPTFAAQLKINQTVLHGTVSQHAYHTFEAWQKSIR